MTNYFTISEFAKLRNININSLRYYEKIGVLKPAYIDEKNGYRYYSPEQLCILDIILLCIDFGMPLKEMSNYIGDSGFIKSKELFETGKKIAQEKIRSLQTELDKIDYTLNFFKVNQQYSEKNGFYERSIPDRTIVTLDYDGDISDMRMIEMASGRLYGYAEKRGMSPVFPAGLIVRSDGEEMKVKIYFEIVDKDISDDAVATLPSGDFMCHQIDMTPRLNLHGVIESAFGANEKSEIIVANMLLDNYRIGLRKGELQKRITRGL